MSAETRSLESIARNRIGIEAEYEDVPYPIRVLVAIRPMADRIKIDQIDSSSVRQSFLTRQW